MATIFLDRDGTLNIDTGYVVDPNDVTLIEGAGNAVAAFKSAGYEVAIVTNQSAVARGYGTKEQVEDTNQRLVEMLAEEADGAVVDKVFYCPHGPEDNCACRKPKTGMLGDDKQAYEQEAASSWMVGDKLSDIRFGLELGIKADHCILVRTGYGAETEKSLNQLGPEGSEVVVVDSIKDVASVVGA